MNTATREINMSENSNEAIQKSSDAASTTETATKPVTEQSAESSCCKRGSCCKPHTSTIIALLALVLAGYAAFAASKGHDTSAIETHLGNLDSQIASVNDRIATLDEAVKSNRENLIQTKLKKALQNIQDIGDLAGEGTKAVISEVENMLKTLTSISEQLDTPASTEATPAASDAAATESAAEPTPKSTAVPEPTAPAEITQPESTPSQSTQAEPTAAPEQPAAAEPTTTAPDSSATDQVPATTEIAPANTPAKDQTATTTPPIDPAPVAEPSAPQAF